ncbi:MAG: sugar ABC transporter substrate-binding protein [Propionibacteriaceae bacterium]|jgi:multiple sugar transport system substrate-binding protein|nr:sugar ABC transporter substrate-binding protein [Propionibacteriaceae bacterium]
MRKSRTKKAVGLLAAVVAASGVAGCSQGSATTPGGGAQTAGNAPVTVRYMNFSSNDDGHEADLAAIVAAFEADNPGIKIAVETVPYADYAAKLQTALAGGTEADVFELEYEPFVSYAKAGVLADITGIDTSVYSPSLIQAYQSDGKQFALPESFSTVVLFYNQDLFDAAGLDYPTDSWTWADETKAAEALTDKDKGVWGDYQPISYNEFYKTVAQSGGQFLNAEGTATAFNDQAGLAAAEWLTGKSGKTMPTDADGANSPDFDTNLFISGKLAMWHMGIWRFSTIAEKAPDMNWDIVVEPGNTQKASAMFSNAVAISAKSQVQDAAQRWLAFYTASQTTIDTRLAKNWELPPVADQSKLDAYVAITPPANRQAVLDSLDAVALAPVVERQQEMQDIINDELAAVAAGRTPAADALANMRTKVDPLLG